MPEKVLVFALNIASALHLGAALLFFSFCLAGLQGEAALAIAGSFWFAYVPTYALLLLACLPAFFQRRPLDFQVKFGLSTPLLVALMVGLSALGSARS